MEEVRSLLEGLERRLPAMGPEEALPALAFIAGEAVPVDPSELLAARRRAMLLLAAGGDPRRGLALDGRAVTSLAADLSAAERRAALAASLDRMKEAARGLPTVEAFLDLLIADSELAWRSYACARLAEELED